MKQHQRFPGPVDLVVHRETVDLSVAALIVLVSFNVMGCTLCHDDFSFVKQVKCRRDARERAVDRRVVLTGLLAGSEAPPPRSDTPLF